MTCSVFISPLLYVVGEKVKVKCTIVQALRLCTGRTAHRGSRGIAVPFHDHGTRRGWGISVTPRPLYTPRNVPVPIVQEAGWAPGSVWTGAENLAPTGIRSPELPVPRVIEVLVIYFNLIKVVGIALGNILFYIIYFKDSILIRSNEMQQYAGVYVLKNYSTYFKCLSHPSSGVHQTVTAVSGTGHVTCQSNNLLPALPN